MEKQTDEYEQIRDRRRDLYIKVGLVGGAFGLSFLAHYYMDDNIRTLPATIAIGSVLGAGLGFGLEYILNERKRRD